MGMRINLPKTVKLDCEYKKKEGARRNVPSKFPGAVSKPFDHDTRMNTRNCGSDDDRFGPDQYPQQKPRWVRTGNNSQR